MPGVVDETATDYSMYSEKMTQ